MSPRTGDLSLSIGLVDVLHPAYQRFASEVAQDLLRTDIDGLVLEDRKVKGFAGEWSTTSRRMFEGLVGPSVDSHDRPVAPDLWRWVGWKTRTYLGFVTGLTQQLRQTRPGFLVAVIVHERALLAPAEALTEYGEDVLEAKQRGFSLVIRPEPGISGRSDQQAATMEIVRQRLARTPGDERQLWLGLALHASDPSSLITAIRSTVATKVGQGGTHLLLMNGAAIP
jgi:hypothetical protein